MSESADPDPRRAQFDPRRPVDRELELTVGAGFTLIAVGDCILSRPVSQLRSARPAFAALLDVLAAGTAVYGNLETVLLDPGRCDGAPHAWRGDWPLSCDPAVAHDLRSMGFHLLSRANNHALDWGPEGMRETTRLLDAHGLTHAGTGETLALARRAQFRETPQGRVGLVSCTTTFRETTDGLNQREAAPGRPGVSGLALKRFLSVPDQLFGQLAAVRQQLAADGIADLLLEIEPHGGAQATYRYEMHPGQLAEILKQVRQGKQFADFMVVALHSHEALTTPDPGQPIWAPPLPATFVSEFGRRAIDAGADAVIVTGVHHLGPIEIYRRRPILTGLGNFFWSDVQTPLAADIYESARGALKEAFGYPERATDADLTLLMNHPYFTHEENFLGAVAEMRFDPTGLRELILHPVDLGYGDPLSLSGLPRLAGRERARLIFDRLSAISAPNGIELSIQGEAAHATTLAEVLI